jgi:hypothetical protein
MVVFLHVQDFIDKLSLNLVFCNPFDNCSIATSLLQSENVFQLIINLFIFELIYDTLIYWDVNHHELKSLVTKCFSNIHYDITKFHRYRKLSNCDKFLSTS